MPNPTLSDVHIDRPLTNISTAFIQQEGRFIATRVFPVVPVSKKSDSYFTYPQSYWYRTEAQIRAPGSQSAGSGWTQSTDNYSCDVIAVHKDIDDQTRANADVPINLDREATQWITQQLLLKREIDWATAYFAASTWTGSTTAGDITPSALWDTAASTPIEDISAQILNVEKVTGYTPNVFVVGAEAHDHLKNHADILERIKYTQRGIVTEDLLAGLLGVDRYFVARAVRNTAAEGNTASYSFINNSKNALLVYAAPAPSLMQPSGGYCFTWSQYGAGLESNRISRFRIDEIKSDRVEGEMAYDFKLVSPTCGVFFSAVVS